VKDKNRAIPAVEKVLNAIGSTSLPRPLVTKVVRHYLSTLREQESIPDMETILAGIRSELARVTQGRIQPIINGTGIVIHTNFGRAPLSENVMDAIGKIGRSYNNLEFDLCSGERGSRAAYVEALLALLCEAEAAAVVNNCAAALVLILRHFTRAKPEVIISRGELVQIGGGFRIPEILESSGAKLREIGTTNKTGIDDYRAAAGERTGLILKVHKSNFYMGGFVENPSTEEISALAREKDIPLVEDLGSGAAIPTEKIEGLPHEPTAAEVVRAGVDLVCFSGDKLFGGPQAGIIAGRSKMVAALKRDPLFRALRCDKLILCGLQATLEAHLNGRSGEIPDIPVLQMLAASRAELHARAERLLAAIKNPGLKIEIGKGKAEAGGGTLPEAKIDSVTLDISPRSGSLEKFAELLRGSAPPVIGYIAGHRFKLDLRTVFPEQECRLTSILNELSLS
jgi:L-seryl-tRNA(Ser) seleniumtransferase